MIQTQGATANLTGAALEAEIVGTLAEVNIPAVVFSAWNGEKTTKATLVRQFKYTKWGNGNGKGDFMLFHPAFGNGVVIEARSQRTAGSVDEKLPALLINAIKAAQQYKTHMVIIVLDGAGVKENLRVQLTRAAAGLDEFINKPTDVTVHVMTLAQFRAFVSSTLRG